MQIRLSDVDRSLSCNKCKKNPAFTNGELVEKFKDLCKYKMDVEELKNSIKSPKPKVVKVCGCDYDYHFIRKMLGGSELHKDRPYLALISLRDSLDLVLNQLCNSSIDTINTFVIPYDSISNSILSLDIYDDNFKIPLFNFIHKDDNLDKYLDNLLQSFNDSDGRIEDNFVTKFFTSINDKCTKILVDIGYSVAKEIGYSVISIGRGMILLSGNEPITDNEINIFDKEGNNLFYKLYIQNYRNGSLPNLDFEYRRCDLVEAGK